MLPDDKNKYLQDNLLEWFEQNKRIFPWRNPSLSSYQIIISEILLQRTKADTVSRFFDSFTEEYPDWPTLARAPLETVEAYLRPIGLYKQRAKRLQNLAQYMVINGGVIPLKRSELDEVPFMGQYIANAVELLIHKRNSPLLDVNMARVLERYFGPRKMADIRYDPYLQNLAYELVQHEHSKFINWAILDFAALICVARKPKCLGCPFKNKCSYFLNLA